ncbi:DUF6153 family protein [Nocardiopsis potens]|uniref:DUF6153 family protein n=1 Tax=Nocardiopsis potens TaxID=1246458 RepID=UPI00035EE54E|nr:DUF6153 family protein [Nocardiopsis potens]
MGRGPVAGRGAPAWLRALVLLCVLFGVGAMHTLGHLESHGQHGAPPAAAAAQAHPDAPAAHPDAAAGRASPSGHHSPDGDGAPLPPLDPTSVCLALAGAVLTALLATAAAHTRSPLPPALFRAAQAPPAPAVRRPPAPPSLSALQVLRI